MIIEPKLPTSIKQRRFWNAPHGSALALALADTGRAHGGLVVAVARDTHAAHALEADLGTFAGGDLDVLHFPDWETLPYDLFAPHPDIVSQRIATLYRLPSRRTRRARRAGRDADAATRADAASSRLGARARRCARSSISRPSSAASKPPATATCRRCGEPGDFAVRGALLDIFPMGSAEPYRIELFDEEIESIRTFDPETQRSDAEGRIGATCCPRANFR